MAQLIITPFLRTAAKKIALVTEKVSQTIVQADRYITSKPALRSLFIPQEIQKEVVETAQAEQFVNEKLIKAMMPSILQSEKVRQDRLARCYAMLT